MAKAPIKTPVKEETALQRAMEMLGTGLGHLEEHIEDRDELLGDDAALAMAHLLTKVAQVAGELRKAEAHDLKAAGEISIKAIIDFARRGSPADRKQLVRQIQDIDADAGRSGLA